ncbi:MAG: hypothetical protein RLZZ303_296 [Candidatus Hydrogenedentota bacterium]
MHQHHLRSITRPAAASLLETQQKLSVVVGLVDIIAALANALTNWRDLFRE